MVIISKNQEQTLALSHKIAISLKGGDILSLVGDLGAGKTVLARGISDFLGVKQGVKSPTFTLMNLYLAKNKQGIKKICHIDAYRLNTSADLLAIGVEDFFEDPEVLTIIEWGGKAKDILPKRTKIINIEQLSENERSFNFDFKLYV